MPKFCCVIIFTLSSFVILFLLSKLLGKKQIAQMDFADYVIGISIGSIAGNMATDLESPFYHYVIAMVGFFVLDLAINFLGRKGWLFKWMVQGRPVTLVYEGKIIYKNLKKNRLDVNGLLSLCRSKNYFDISDIYYAVLETSGDLSVIPTAGERPVVASDLNADNKKPSLPNYLVCDGAISYSGLNEIGKNENWLFSRLNLNSKKDLKQLVLVAYDSETDRFITHYKEG